MTTTNAVPEVIARYLAAADAKDIDALVACFGPDATVLDEGKTYTGHDQIRAWREATISSWTYTTEVTGTEPIGDAGYQVNTHLEGDFPGRVVDLRFQFAVTDGLISDLRIVE
jgi:ketosteroid isomerase-like protein